MNLEDLEIYQISMDIGEIVFSHVDSWDRFKTVGIYKVEEDESYYGNIEPLN